MITYKHYYANSEIGLTWLKIKIKKIGENRWATWVCHYFTYIALPIVHPNSNAKCDSQAPKGPFYLFVKPS